tara:strand:+ start:105 stop:632 length:528 start_codon:yes stop_codon:yes gene_type:complete
MNKKGAIELSMTTIIVIVIGITILSLGLAWISSIFTDVGELTSGAFEQGATQIAAIFGSSNEEVALSPGETTIGQGDTETVTLAIRNSGTTSATEVYATVEALAFGGGNTDTVLCGFDDTGTDTTNKYNLGSGDSTSRGLIVKDVGSDLGTYICAITVHGLPTGEKQTSLVVTIE